MVLARLLVREWIEVEPAEGHYRSGGAKEYDKEKEEGPYSSQVLGKGDVSVDI